MSGPARKNICSPPFVASVVDSKSTLLTNRWPEVSGFPVAVPELTSRFGLAGGFKAKSVSPKYCGTVNQAVGGAPFGCPTNLVRAGDDPARTSKGCTVTPPVSANVPAGIVMYATSLDPMGAYKSRQL